MATEIWIATSNKGKLDEIKMLLNGLDVEIHGIHELSFYSSPPETGDSFLANAKIKARSLAKVKPGVWVIADDSGLEVNGLNQLPGIHSARYAGDKASDAENNAKLLKMLSIRSPKDRTARFRCVIVAYDPTDTEWSFDGTLEGEISKKLVGHSGFGYDPLFIPQGETKTVAELGAAYKNQFSHRAQAMRQLKQKIITQLSL